MIEKIPGALPPMHENVESGDEIGFGEAQDVFGVDPLKRLARGFIKGWRPGRCLDGLPSSGELRDYAQHLGQREFGGFLGSSVAGEEGGLW